MRIFPPVLLKGSHIYISNTYRSRLENGSRPDAASFASVSVTCKGVIDCRGATENSLRVSRRDNASALTASSRAASSAATRSGVTGRKGLSTAPAEGRCPDCCCANAGSGVSGPKSPSKKATINLDLHW